MHDESTRSAVLRLSKEGHGTRVISRVLRISRTSVKHILAQQSAEVPLLVRAEKADPYRDQILELLHECKGNLVRVHEELALQGADFSYQTLTAFCRRHLIGRELPKPSGQYDFNPGEEMQHDTSPHQAKIGGRLRRVQTASLVLCYSHMLFFQHYPQFTRFFCKIFNTEAVKYFEGACARCMIDNTHVVVLSGTGRDMVPVPEMVAFAERLGFQWRAHAKGDANRSARVERPFDFIENNFLAGREFADWDDLNQQARAWCDKVNGTHKRHLHASPRELFATERLHLVPLPAWVPEVYQLHQRIVDVEGYVHVNRTRYSAPWQLVGRHVEVRETKDRIELYQGPRLVATHKHHPEPTLERVTLPEHRPPRGQGSQARRALEPEKAMLVKLHPEMARYVELLEKRHRTVRDLRRLVRLTQEYPQEPLLAAVRIAAHYGLDDLERLERLTLRNVAQDFFLLPPDAAAGASNAERREHDHTPPTPTDSPPPQTAHDDNEQAKDPAQDLDEDRAEDSTDTEGSDD